MLAWGISFWSQSSRHSIIRVYAFRRVNLFSSAIIANNIFSEWAKYELLATHLFTISSTSGTSNLVYCIMRNRCTAPSYQLGRPFIWNQTGTYTRIVNCTSSSSSRDGLAFDTYSRSSLDAVVIHWELFNGPGCEAISCSSTMEESTIFAIRIFSHWLKTHNVCSLAMGRFVRLWSSQLGVHGM